MRPIKAGGGEKQTILKLMSLHPKRKEKHSLSSHQHCYFASHKNFKLMSSILIEVSHSDMKSRGVRVREEEEKKRLHRGRQRSLQRDGNKEQMEFHCQNELTFIFTPFFFPFPFSPTFLFSVLQTPSLRSQDLRRPLYLRGPEPGSPRVRQRDRRLLHQDRESHRHR